MDKDSSTVKSTTSPVSVREIALLFLKLGTIGFGGPAAHISMMQEEVVKKRQWLSQEKFLDFLGATYLIPGPNSTEMAIHIGYEKAGWLGLLIAGICFIFPAVFIVLAAAIAYVKFGTFPEVQGILYGIKPVVIAIVVQALWTLFSKAAKNFLLILGGIVSMILSFLGANELIILFGCGIIITLLKLSSNTRKTKFSIGLFSIPSLLSLRRILLASDKLSPPLLALPSLINLHEIFLFFLKVGSVLYGSGYVLLAFLQNGLVEQRHWLTQTELLDAISIGQFTPGPVFTTATFIGYLLSGFTGALVATLGIFLPSFIFVAFSGFLIPFIRKSKIAGTFLDGVNIASVGLMAAVTFQLGKVSLIDWQTIAITVMSLILLFRFRLNSTWLILGSYY